MADTQRDLDKMNPWFCGRRFNREFECGGVVIPAGTELIIDKVQAQQHWAVVVVPDGFDDLHVRYLEVSGVPLEFIDGDEDWEGWKIAAQVARDIPLPTEVSSLPEIGERNRWELAQAIHAHRMIMKLSMKDLGVRLGVSGRVIQMWEERESAPTLKQVMRLEQALLLEPGRLFRDAHYA